MWIDIEHSAYFIISYRHSTESIYGDKTVVNPYLTNGFSHHNHLGESTFIFRGVRSDFKILFHFSMKFL